MKKRRSDCESGWEHPLGDTFLSSNICGGYSGEDPPLPIPNREVKLTRADGTDPPVGRVGRRRFSEARTSIVTPGLLRYPPSSSDPVHLRRVICLNVKRLHLERCTCEEATEKGFSSVAL